MVVSHSVCTEHCTILTGAAGAHKLNFIHQILPKRRSIFEGTKKTPVFLGNNGLGIFLIGVGGVVLFEDLFCLFFFFFGCGGGFVCLVCFAFVCLLGLFVVGWLVVGFSSPRRIARSGLNCINVVLFYHTSTVIKSLLVFSKDL